jgi:hypothetical protein
MAGSNFTLIVDSELNVPMTFYMKFVFGTLATIYAEYDYHGFTPLPITSTSNFNFLFDAPKECASVYQ